MNKIATNRKIIIDEILSDLALLRKDSSYPSQYAVVQTIEFFESLDSFWSNIKWLSLKAPKLKREQLLELADFPSSLFAKWDKDTQLKLIELERRPFPGIVKPLVDEITKFILGNTSDFLLVGNLGCGAMEIERQIINELIQKKYNKKIVFVGIDKSSAAHELAKNNFRELKTLVKIYEIDQLNSDVLRKTTENVQGQYTLILAKNNLLTLDKFFKENEFDLIFHSLFKHHLAQDEKNQLDKIISKIAQTAYEYDGYKNWPLIFIHTIYTWNDPAFLNATILSDLRYFSKYQLYKTLTHNENIKFFSRGTYLKRLGMKRDL